MKSPTINIIVAKGKNNEIGKNGQLIWHISDDLKRFKKITMGGVLIMGRKTYESIGRPLPGRINIVVTRRKDYPDEGTFITHSPEEALEKARCFGKPVFIIGGEQIYRALLPRAERLYITEIDAEDPAADAFFPSLEQNKWKIKEGHSTFIDSSTHITYKYIEYTKVK